MQSTDENNAATSTSTTSPKTEINPMKFEDFITKYKNYEVPMEELAARPAPTTPCQSIYFDLSYVVRQIQRRGWDSKNENRISTELHPLVVKKVMNPLISNKDLLPSIQKLMRDFSFRASCDHPNITKVYGFFYRPDSVKYKYFGILTSNHVGSLDQLLTSYLPLDWPLRIRICLDIAKGLNYLHNNNIIHNDIKSSNILYDHDYNFRINDFKSSLREHESQPESRTIFDSVLSPEGGGSRSNDVYSFGVLLCEISARAFPFIKCEDLIRSWSSEENRNKKIPQDTPLKFANLIKHCWQTNPEDRPTMSEVVESLQLQIEDHKAEVEKVPSMSQ